MTQANAMVQNESEDQLNKAIVVGTVVGLTRRPTTGKQFARLLAWAVPLFALPAYC